MSDVEPRPAIVIDRSLCIGSGNCSFFAAATFDLDDEGRAVVIDPLGDDPAAQALAVENCPTRALSLDRDHPIGTCEGRME